MKTKMLTMLATARTVCQCGGIVLTLSWSSAKTAVTWLSKHLLQYIFAFADEPVLVDASGCLAFRPGWSMK